MKRDKILIGLLFSMVLWSCKNEKEIHLDLTESPTELSIFGEDFISTELYERDIAISPNGNEIIYTLGDYKQRKRCLVQIRKENEKWGNPEILNISGQYQDIEPFYAENGNKLFFASNRPVDKNSDRKDYNIWFSERSGASWNEPIILSEKINTEQDEFYPSLSKNGNLYFTSTRKEGIGREDIFISKMEGGEYQESEVLDTTINTKYFEFNSFINQDEDLLIFSSFGRPDGLGGGDLYYCQKDKDGKWSEAKNMGKKINSKKLDYCPFVDIERGNFYFTSDRTQEDQSTLSTVDELKRFSNEIQNGMGNIYRIGIDELELE